MDELTSSPRLFCSHSFKISGVFPIASLVFPNPARKKNEMHQKGRKEGKTESYPTSDVLGRLVRVNKSAQQKKKKADRQKGQTERSLGRDRGREGGVERHALETLA
jgi:hypothetical protein